MTKKDYYRFADVLFRTKQEFEGTAAESAVELVAERMADVLESDNASFRREQFLTAAGFGKREV